jgi:nucleotide-binding universal stress UspA family protein
MTIVVGTDLAEGAALATRVAGMLARALSQPVLLVHVSEDPRAPLVIGTSDEHVLTADSQRLADAAESLRREFGVPVSTELEAGVVVDQVCAAAERAAAGLLVIGAGTGGRTLVGRTAEKIARNVRVPVLSVRAGSRLEGWLTTGTPLRVIVGSDLGAASREAESFLTMLDRAGPLDVQAVHVAHPATTHARYGLAPPHDVNALDPAAEQLALRDLTAQGAALPWHDRRRARVVAGTASADTHLSILAEHADLVVVGVRKRSWLTEAWYGSVASAVLRTAPASVLCVPGGLVTAQLPGRPRVIVVATDFSSLGDEAVRTTLSLTDSGATVHLVHVLAGIVHSKPEQRVDAKRQLQQRIPDQVEGFAIHTDVLVGHPATEIVGFARRVGADRICVGSHGRSGVSALLLGSTVHEILARSHVPVLVVPPVRD